MPISLTLTEGVLPSGAEKQAFAGITDAFLRIGQLKGRPSKERKKMKPVTKMISASAAALCTLAFVAIAAPAAHAGEYCRTDTSGMRGCGFSSLEQCQASASGVGGTCARDPFYDYTKSALAYKPKQTSSRSESAVR
jgi:hypothetical protein